MEQLTITEALQQGYTKYLFSSDGFQALQDISNVTEEDLKRKDIMLVEKEPYSPAGISSKDIAELLADHLEDNHSSECGDDTMQVFEAIKDLDFSEAEAKISEALSQLHYYRQANIKLIPNQ